jgi:RpiB/LacA/LacB family sugar-phosphate isomerase
MAGLGSRFVKAGYKIPKQLIYVKEKQLIDLSLESVATTDCNLIFVVRDDQICNFHIDDILKNKFGNEISIVVTDGLTEGSVCSCLLARDHIDNDSPLVIHTLDIQFFPTFDPSVLEGEDCDGLLLTFKSNSTNYSYVATDAAGLATKTAEKKVISPNACVGIYGFKKGSDFCAFADQMIKQDLRTNSEFYISPLYNLLIDAGLKIRTQSVEKMHIFGTPAEFQFYKNNVINKFGKKPVALCSDHSGYTAKENFKQALTELNISFIDFGTRLKTDCDYTYFIEQAVSSMNDKVCDFAFAFCRTGQGVNMCANKFKGIRSALAYDEFAIEMAIRHNCANFFSIPARFFDKQDGKDRAIVFLKICKENSFDGGRHQSRVQSLEG